jgi:hypothetical protein
MPNMLCIPILPIDTKRVAGASRHPAPTAARPNVVHLRDKTGDWKDNKFGADRQPSNLPLNGRLDPVQGGE